MAKLLQRKLTTIAAHPVKKGLETFLSDALVENEESNWWVDDCLNSAIYESLEFT